MEVDVVRMTDYANAIVPETDNEFLNLKSLTLLIIGNIQKIF